jgi:hypothetical protein
MDPPPPSDLDGATEEDRIRYRHFPPSKSPLFEPFSVYMPFRKRQYWNLCVPFAEMQLSQIEFAALKALSLWHVCKCPV